MPFTILNTCNMSPLLLQYPKDGSDNALSLSTYIWETFLLGNQLGGSFLDLFYIDLILLESMVLGGIAIFQMRMNNHCEPSRYCHLIKAYASTGLKSCLANLAKEPKLF